MANNIAGTGGAVQMKNEKGEITMKKVKVQRYMAGKRPIYAPESDEEVEQNEEDEQNSGEDNDDIRNWLKNNVAPSSSNRSENEVEDRRLKRLQDRDRNDPVYEQKDRVARHRQVLEPQVLLEDDDDEELNDDKMELDEEENEKSHNYDKESEEEDNEVDEDARIRHRQLVKQKLLEKQDEELLGVEEDQKIAESDESEEEESEYEEEEESESEDEVAPRLKPVFVRKRDRVTIQEKEMEAQKLKQIEFEKQRLHNESHKHTKKMIEDEIKKERLAEKEAEENIVCDFETDDEMDENDYEGWKLRELKRVKRDRDTREEREREKQDIVRLRNMTEEERKADLRANPKVITNLREKGQYKFLQKYYHRGAFFLNEEDEILKRDYSLPTLEDHFDKTTLPKVMQVKNFGMSGRTKYTHLVDQDTTKTDENPWGNAEQNNVKSGGLKQVFERPTAKPKRKN